MYQKIERFAANVSALLLFILMMLTLVDVAGRNLIRQPVPGASELTEILLALVIFLMLPRVALRCRRLARPGGCTGRASTPLGSVFATSFVPVGREIEPQRQALERRPGRIAPFDRAIARRLAAPGQFGEPGSAPAVERQLVVSPVFFGDLGFQQPVLP